MIEFFCPFPRDIASCLLTPPGPYPSLNKMIYDRQVNSVLYFAIVAAGVLAVFIAVLGLGLSDFTFGLALVVAGSLFLSCISHIRLGRRGIFVTLSEVLVFFWLLTFGVSIAILLAAAESAVATISFRNRNRLIEGSGGLFRIAALNASVSALATLATVTVTARVFDAAPNSVLLESNTEMVLLLGLMVVTQFLVSSVFWAIFTSEPKLSKMWHTWYHRCLNGFALYVVGALAAGIVLRATLENDPIIVLSAIAIGFVVFFTYRRYVNEIKEHHSRAEIAESSRADQARKHLDDLKKQIEKLAEAKSALRTSEAKFRHAAYHDPLTRLPNQNLLNLELEKAFSKKRATADYNFAVLYIDLNKFKSINETLGHLVADEFLRSVSARILETVKEKDFLARVASDEFALIAADVLGPDEARSIAESMIGRLSAPFNIDGKILFTSVSIGIALCDKHGHSTELLRDARIAMHKAKSLEKPLAVFDSEMYALAVGRLETETHLRGALERREFVAYYQPIVDLKDMRTAGFEALIRWQHPEKGLVAPGEFISICEDSGMIVPITSWILEEACKTMVKWHWEAGVDRATFISVNLSAKDFAQGDIVDRVKQVLETTGLTPICLKLEITESAIMSNSDMAVEMLKDLRSLGCRLSIDDFGTGYSSLSYLHKFPVDTLKVDRSFVSSMEFGSENGEIVRTVITLAKLLGMKIISEGIESVHQLHQLKILECEFGQGSLFSMPVPESEALAMLKSNTKWSGLVPGHAGSLLVPASQVTVIRLDEDRMPHH